MIATEPALEISSFYIWLQCGAVLLMGGLVVLAWHRRSMPGAVPFAVLMVAFSQWLTGVAFQFNTESVAVKLLWFNYYQLAIYTAVAAWVILTLQIAGFEKPLLERVRWAEIISLAAVFLLTLFNYRGLLLGDFQQPYPWFQGAAGPYFWVIWILPVGWAFFGVACSLRQCSRVGGALRQQLVLLLVGTVPLIAAYGWMFLDYFINRKNAPQGLALLVVAGVACALIFAWAIFRGRYFEIMQLAQAEVAAQTEDCLIALDARGYIADLNPAAAALLGNSRQELCGVTAWEAFACWPILRETAACPEAQSLEAFYEEGEGKHYQIELLPLTGPFGQPLGKAILLRDITAGKLAQIQLQEQQKTLTTLADQDRLGRELHDDQEQVWSYLNLQLQTVLDLLNKEESGAAATGVAAEARRNLERLVDVTRDLQQDVQESLTGLKSLAASEEGLIPTLQEHLTWFERKYGIATQLVIPDQSLAGVLSLAASLQLLRIIQEALTNVRKHAGAKQVRVIIQRDAEELKICVADDGRGFDPAAVPEGEHYGLPILRERAAEAGGTLTIESQPGAGTKVIVRIALV